MIMHLNEFEQIKDKINTKYLTGCDSSLANLYLLKESLNTSFFQKEEILFRKYDFAESIKGYGFPILLSKNHKIEDKFEVFFKEIKKKEQNSIDFCYFTEEQKNLFDEFLAKKGLSVEWKTNSFRMFSRSFKVFLMEEDSYAFASNMLHRLSLM